MRGDFKAIIVGVVGVVELADTVCICMWCRIRYSASASEEVINCRERRGGVEDWGEVRLLDMV